MDYARRPYVAGKFPNEPETLVRWILDPPALAPHTAMPAVPMTDQDARDMAAYLYELIRREAEHRAICIASGRR